MIVCFIIRFVFSNTRQLTRLSFLIGEYDLADHPDLTLVGRALIFNQERSAEGPKQIIGTYLLTRLPDPALPERQSFSTASPAALLTALATSLGVGPELIGPRCTMYAKYDRFGEKQPLLASRRHLSGAEVAGTFIQYQRAGDGEHSFYGQINMILEFTVNTQPQAQLVTRILVDPMTVDCAELSHEYQFKDQPYRAHVPILQFYETSSLAKRLVAPEWIQNRVITVPHWETNWDEWLETSCFQRRLLAFLPRLPSDRGNALKQPIRFTLYVFDFQAYLFAVVLP